MNSWSAGRVVLRDTFARLPLMRTMAAVERLTKAKGRAALPEYARAEIA
ncbi:hypothetical protein [Streptomyces glomeratus]|nr:hypothetical protein [Streptomyces glomeratus]MCF1506206.1 hypothetical protein [Streptomyces glomeratus]